MSSVPSDQSRAVGSRARVPGENQVVIERKHVTVTGKDTHTLSLPRGKSCPCVSPFQFVSEVRGFSAFVDDRVLQVISCS